MGDTGAALKAQVAAASGLHASHQKLISEGTVVSDVVTMSELGFHAGIEATVFLVSGLTLCSDCGRKFTNERIEMHSRVCAGARKRTAKVFNSIEKRLGDFNSEGDRHLIAAALQNYAKEDTRNN